MIHSLAAFALWVEKLSRTKWRSFPSFPIVLGVGSEGGRVELKAE